MRKAYEDVEAVWQMRRRAMPQMSYEEASYLDRRLKAAQDHYLVLKINRHSILSDAFDQLWHREKRELLRPLRVRMGIEEGEIGHDLGGVQIEFFKLACQEAFRAEYCTYFELVAAGIVLTRKQHFLRLTLRPALPGFSLLLCCLFTSTSCLESCSGLPCTMV